MALTSEGTVGVHDGRRRRGSASSPSASGSATGREVARRTYPIDPRGELLNHRRPVHAGLVFLLRHQGAGVTEFHRSARAPVELDGRRVQAPCRSKATADLVHGAVRRCPFPHSKWYLH